MTVFQPKFQGGCAWVALVLVLGLSGCTRRTTPARLGQQSQTLLLGNGAEPEDLDPQIITAYTDQVICLALFEGLTAVDEVTSEAVPAAAQSWTSSADGRTWTFHLRKNLRWSNGEPLLAGDFVQSWLRILDPALGAQYAYLLYPIRNAEAFNEGRSNDPSSLGISAPDDATVRIELGAPTFYLPVLVAQPAWFPVNPRILARFDAIKRRGTAWTRPGNLVGNGPFILDQWSPNARISVLKNPNYWNSEAVSLRGMVFFPIDSPDAEELAFRTGQLHLTYSLPTSKIAGYRSDSRLRIDPFLQTFFLRFNVTRKPLDQVKVRQALSLAIDRDAIAAHVLYGAYPAATCLTPDGCGGYHSRARIGFDPERARRLLAEAGYPGGQTFPILEVQTRNDETEPRVMEAIQAMWKKELGIEVSLASFEQKTWLQNQQTLNYSVSTAGWAGDFPDPVTFLDLFVSQGGNNWTGWSDSDYDHEIKAAASDSGARFECFQKAEALLLQSCPITPLYSGSRVYLIDPAVRGWKPALLGFHRYSQVGLAPP